VPYTSVQPLDRQSALTIQSTKRVEKEFFSRSSLTRPLGTTSVNAQSLLVGRPGLDPGTLRLKVSCSSR
jgi:hypothetical protein